MPVLHVTMPSTRNAGSAGSPQPRAFGLWNLGFRPFYLLGSLCAAISIALWVVQYAGWLPFAYLVTPRAHAGEMVFGYAMAVIAGFLFTAARNWTGQPTPHGGALAALALLWLAGRILAATPWTTAAAAADGLFPLAVAAGLAVPLARARNRRNYFFVALLALLGVVGFAGALAQHGVVAWPAGVDLRVALDLVLFLMVVMGGRVIPMFTNNGVPGARARRVAGVERAALAGVIVLAAADALGLPDGVLATVCAVLAGLHAARLALWQPWRTRRVPLVWILHAAYAWIVVHLSLRALAALDLVSPILATHALTIGGIGGLTIGMMTRTARGHTGRPLVASRTDVACYGLVLAAALARVAGPLAWPSAYVATVVVSGACWSVAFLLYAFSYAPWLLRARPDGKPG